MAPTPSVFKERKFKCTKCGEVFKFLSWDSDPNPDCTCGAPSDHHYENLSSAPMINPDSIPGGVEIRHGVCWPDGSPRKFYSYSEIRQAAYDKGVVLHGETPNLNPRLKDAEDERKSRSR